MTTHWTLVITVAAVAGCGATLEQLQRRAAIDLDCPSEAISSNEVDSQTRIATGCGRRAVYVETCSNKNRTACTWMLNSPVRPASVQNK